MGFPLGLVSAPKRYLVVHGLHCCRCAVAMLPPAAVGVPLCVPLDAFQLPQTDIYLMSGGVGLRSLNRRVALRILCGVYYESLCSGTLLVLMPFDDHVALCDPVSLFVSGSARMRDSLSFGSYWFW